MQILLNQKEVQALRKEAADTSKSYSQLVREAINNTFVSPWKEEAIAKMARDARQGKGTKKFKNAQAFLRYLWGA